MHCLMRFVFRELVREDYEAVGEKEGSEERTVIFNAPHKLRTLELVKRITSSSSRIGQRQ